MPSSFRLQSGLVVLHPSSPVQVEDTKQDALKGEGKELAI